MIEKDSDEYDKEPERKDGAPVGAHGGVRDGT